MDVWRSGIITVVLLCESLGMRPGDLGTRPGDRGMGGGDLSGNGTR